MDLPQTYYDIVRCGPRHFVLEMAELDAKDILSVPGHSTTVYSVDDYPNRYNQCLDQLQNSLIDFIATKTGLSVDNIRNHIATAPPDIKAYMAKAYHTANFEYYAFINFALSGKKTFFFSNNLSDHLANTEINLKANLVELPFPSCLFTFTSPTVINAMHNICGYDGRWNMNTSELDYSAPVSVFVTMHPGSPEHPERRLLILSWHARPPEKSYLMLKRELFMKDDWTLEQSLRTDWEKIDPENCGPGISIGSGVEGIEPQQDDKFYTDGLTFYRIILNAILYLSSDQSEKVEKKTPRREMENIAAKILSIPKRRKALKMAAHHSILDYEEVGASVGTIIIQHNEPGNREDIGKGPGGKPAVRFIVRGHWRHQPHGQGNKDRKLVWIRPFYKGPDLAHEINKPYLVK